MGATGAGREDGLTELGFGEVKGEKTQEQSLAFSLSAFPLETREEVGHLVERGVWLLKGTSSPIRAGPWV